MPKTMTANSQHFLHGLPDFSQINPQKVEPAIDQLLASNRMLVARLLAETSAPDWDHFVEPLDIAEDCLNRAWSPVSHLNAVVNTEELRAVYNACLPKLSDYATEMGQNQALFDAYQAVAANPDLLSDEQKEALRHILRDFRLSGVALEGTDKQRFREIACRLSQLTSKYEENVLDATHAWSKLITDRTQLAGLPESTLALAAQTATKRGLEGWLLTLDYPIYQPVMTHADNRALRFELYHAYTTRASDQGPYAGKYDNSQPMQEILALRLEASRLLGFANHAERSLATKMARNTGEVLGFLNDLAQRTRPQALAELEELRVFARAEHGMDELEPWDIAYYSEQLRLHKYAISQEQLRPYFPLPRVLDGLFNLAARLFELRVEEIPDAPGLWHPDARLFALLSPHGELIGRFYLDPYACAHKRGGAWMDGCIDRMQTSEGLQTPVAFLVCNFSPPIGDQPALLTHDEVQTLFHEFGHGLQHLLTRVGVVTLSGINGVPWDAVELPSQLMENWCWDTESVSLFSGHFETGEPLPGNMLEKLLAARNFQSAMGMIRQLEFSLFDFRLHVEFDPADIGQPQRLLAEVRNDVGVLRPPEWNRTAHSFTHIFGGGYAAGYYSYKWAEVLSADAFSLFEERGTLDAATGRSFRQHILETGGSVDAMQSFISFRGRPPTVDALLRHNGIALAG